MGELLTRSNRFLEVLNCTLLGLKAVALLVMKPTQLLQHFCMTWITLKHSPIGGLGTIILRILSTGTFAIQATYTYVFLLFMDMTNLEPDIFLS
jgi:hypothetical protein